ncbi:MAG: 2-amino-4-hydroxy-6-hydroxymethyldihydropteridine diphosphokinase [Proteobacteria bacterium]|nr:2-amino-4-hydroxy-6-hydroxymethyldihydropteridine diphosphokinase [Pseudomonadota bacterium]
MILIGLGANLLHPVYGEPVSTLKAAIEEIGGFCTVEKCSSWYQSAPVPMSDQPWFVNAVIAVSSDLSLEDFLQKLHGVERSFGRIRKQKWEARVLDLDLLAYNDLVTKNESQDVGPVVPHPRLSERAFVVAPLAEILPDWRHSKTGEPASELLKKLPEDQEFRILPNDGEAGGE